ncbi:MAG: fimC 1 [Pseudomonas sp.]|nr:fimC 1 [Pseudomonas sp.]
MVYTTIRYARSLLVAALVTALAAPAQAGIVLNTTRIIYPASDKEVSFGVHNTGTGEILLQSWLESNSQEAADLPFVITPALARMPGDAKQLLRIMYAGSDMPQDRESVFWLNVQEIPQAASENALQIAVRQRIKVFFRPLGLQAEPARAPEELQWRLVKGDVLNVSNPGPYYVSMVKIDVQDGATQMMKKDSQMLAPKHSMNLPLKRSAEGRSLSLSFVSIDDFGGQVPYRATLNSQDASTAVRVAKTDIAPQ